MHRFEHEAMNTSMEIVIDGVTKSYAASAADDAFWVLKNLEEQLSMFVSYSEISVLNLLKPGGVRMVSESTMQALAGAMYVASVTGGAVDVCCGEFFLNAKGKERLE